MSGGLFGVVRSYWFELGEYDESFHGWGGENVELSLRVWLCGGEIVVQQTRTAACCLIGPYYVVRRLGARSSRKDSIAGWQTNRNEHA